MTEGKKFIQTVKALKTIYGVVEEGGIYKLSDLERMFPYINFENTDYFQKLYNCDKFKKGDKVRYTGKGWESFSLLEKNCVFQVTDVKHNVIKDLLYTTYVIKKDKSFDTFDVKECELESAASKWIVSFSNICTQNKPSVHEIDYFSYENRIKNTWKKIFVFDTKEEAEIIAQMLSEHTLNEIYEKIKKVEFNTQNKNSRNNIKKLF